MISRLQLREAPCDVAQVLIGDADGDARAQLGRQLGQHRHLLAPHHQRVCQHGAELRGVRGTLVVEPELALLQPTVPDGHAPQPSARLAEPKDIRKHICKPYL